ncbi:MAG: PKD domain-containing protein [Myxococcus sp.]|nr:PKD domain-containing protein [Myxococcus sp.]
MRGFVVLVVWCLCASACARAVREERREQPIDTGHAVSFSAEGPRRWDFGDGTNAEGQVVEHAFAKAGRYEVRALDGERVSDRVSVLVQPRDVFRAVAPDAEAVLVFRTLDDVAPAIDFVERVGSGASAQQLLERSPLLHFILEPGAAAAALDRAEGAGVYLPSAAPALVSFVGVSDGPAAARAVGERMLERGWRAGAGAAGHSFVAGQLNARLFVDRGTLFLITAPEVAAVEQAARHVIEAPSRGLEADPTMAAALAELASGGVALLVRRELSARLPGAVKPAAWSLALAALKFGEDDARLVGRIVAGHPLWPSPPPSRPARLLAHAPEGLTAALSLDVPVAEVLQALGLSRPEDTEDDELRAALSVLSRRLDLTISFDVEAFLRATVRTGRPAPRFTVLAEALVPDRLAVRAVLERALARRRGPLDAVTEGGVTVWRTQLEDQPLELALGPDTLFARWGRPLVETTPIDLVAQLSRRAEGACGPGHLTALLDVGQLGRDLREPRMVPGVDPRRVLTTQALTSTFLAQVTALDEVFFDLAPSPAGATVFIEVKLSKRPGRE